MIHKKTYTALIFVSFLTLFFACSVKPNESLAYVAIQKRDTATLSLTLYESTFHGKMNIRRPGNIVDSGTVEGNIHKDTLIGSFYYRPHGAKYKKRRGLALLRNKDTWIQGTGLESVYMGVTYYIPTSISFETPTYIFQPEKLSE